MLKFFKRLFFNRSLDEVLNETKSVKIQGVLFKIKKLSTLDHLSGAKVLTQQYDIYRKDTNSSDPNLNKIKEHFRDVFLSCVVKPTIVRKESEDGILVDDIFINWEMANELYGHIIVYTYGKKKIREMFRGLKN